MKTIELNLYSALVFGLMIAGIGSVLPSFFNIAGFMSGIVYCVSAVALARAYKAKLYYKLNTKE